MTVEGVLVVDKPAGWTSHDVVAKVRRLAGTRRVGHAGTLDPMATGVLVLGLGRATRLLGHLAGSDKTYLATIRLGRSTTTDDAEGEPLADVPGAADLSPELIAAAMRRLTGELDQVPSAVSAVKIAGVRSYARVRAGEQVELAPRRVRVDRFELLARRGADLEVEIDCGAGTYVRALARDLGADLGVGGHLTALRRTHSGPYRTTTAVQLAELEPAALKSAVVSLDEAAAAAFPRRELTDQESAELAHGRPLALLSHDSAESSGAALSHDSAESPTEPPVVAAFDPAGRCVALLRDRDGAARPVVVFRPAGLAPVPAG